MVEDKVTSKKNCFHEKKIKSGNPEIFQNIRGYIPGQNQTGIPGIEP